jgi:outer membrane protein
MMKANEILRTLLLSVLLLAWSPVVNAAELIVHLEDQPPMGTVVFVLFDSANTFGDLRDPVKVVRRRLDGLSYYRIENVLPGEYALLVYYDENDNGRIDKNFIGIPKEPLGFSNQYRPKGPPSYNRAAFMLTEGEKRQFDVKLYRPLGKRGRLGVGLGVIARSSPYRGYDGVVYQMIPAISYNGERLRIYGPNIQIGLVGSGKLRLAATGKYRIGVYKEGESDFLEGMGDRNDTLMAGLALHAELPGGVDLTASYGHDVLEKIGGGAARLEIDKSFRVKIFRFSPKIGLNWLSSKLANHDFGVPNSKATPERTAYYLDATVSIEAGLGMFIEINRDWLIVMSVAAEFLENEVTDSSIVSEDYVISGFGAINYVF